jgi:putative ABC transport system substrate-binding protein
MNVRRREFITLLGGAAAAWPVAARAQQRALPVVGVLNTSSSEASASFVTGFRKGLSEIGYVEGRNVAIEFRWANNEFDRVPQLAADLVRHGVAVIATFGFASALAAKAATVTIPIVYAGGGEPVQAGLVASLNRPGGNVTGINILSVELTAKRVGLLHELLPTASRFGLLVRRGSPNAEFVIKEAQAAASTMGKHLEILYAANNSEIDTAFAGFAQNRIDAVVVSPSPLFYARRAQLIGLAAHHSVPVIYDTRDEVKDGGLMSYGPIVSDPPRQVGIYTGRILKGEKPGDLPVMRSTKFEFVINLQAAKLIGIDVPPTLLALADEVIE